MNLARIAIASGACLLMLLLAGCQQDTKAPEAPRPVRTAIVTLVSGNETLMQTGSITPRLETDLGFQVSGRLMRRLVDVGDTVEKGDLVAAIDPVDIANEVKSAEADLATAIASEVLAHSNLERQQKLLPQQATPLAMAETAEANWQAAVAKRAVAEASLKSARNKLEYTDLRATAAGIVTAVGANAGQVVSMGEIIVRIATVAEKEATFDVAESIINIAPPDATIRVSLLSDPAVFAVGSVREVSPVADEATRTYRVKVALPEAPSAMNLGATVTGSFTLPGKPVVALPAAAIGGADGQPAVFVVDPATGKLSLKTVVIDRYSQDKAYVASGLEAGERVVIAGISKLRPDQIVSVEGDR